ncbi:response regulator transcription factor [uncultured Bifidobacterium sp.]|uniref:response regulator transcription factor n=1 Tax=uncultured Bifidobacterium sp. TaxID=165187 RepID=UPI00338DDC62
MGYTSGRSKRPIGIGIIDNDICAVEHITELVEATTQDCTVLWGTTQPVIGIQHCRYDTRKPHVVLIDMALDGITGDQVALAIRSTCPDIGIVCMTAYSPDRYAGMAVSSTAQTLLDKAMMRKHLPDVLHIVAAGGAVAVPEYGCTFPSIHEAVRLVPQTTSAASSLTDRERQIISLYARGFTSHEIGERLGITPATVISHRRHIKRRLHVSRWSEVIDIWQQIIEKFD